jgi:antitoxin component YwqK of YwqJK toxin-antitoxin module
VSREILPANPVPPQPKDQGPEIPRRDLTLRDDTLYLNLDGTNVPFSGWVTEHYENGQMKFRSKVVNGLLEGLSSGWHTNGQLQVEEHFHAGVSHGLRTKWYQNGRKASEATIVEGRIEGVFRRWHDNGVLSEEIAIKEGRPDGPSRSYYPSGDLKAEATLRNGELVSQRFWKDGQQPGVNPPRKNDLTNRMDVSRSLSPQESREGLL